MALKIPLRSSMASAAAPWSAAVAVWSAGTSLGIDDEVEGVDDVDAAARLSAPVGGGVATMAAAALLLRAVPLCLKMCWETHGNALSQGS